MRNCLQTIFCLLLKFSYLGVNHGAIIISPLNTAALVGEMTTLNCTTNRDPGISWNFNDAQIVNAKPGTSTVPGSCVVRDVYQHLYNVSVSEPGICNLIILHTYLSDGGTYSCHEGTSFSSSAELVMLESNPRCASNATNDIVVESDPVIVGCSVTFNSSGNIQPSLDWVNSTLPVNTTYPNNTFAYAPWIPPIPEDSDLPPYTCILHFNPPTTSPPAGAATNTPALSSSCTTNMITHLWCPKNMNITGPEGGIIYLDKNKITCIASANPNATYEWLNEGNVTIGREQSLRIWNSSIYTCNTTNVINGSPCSRFLTANITVFAAIITTATTAITTTSTTIADETSTTVTVSYLTTEANTTSKSPDADEPPPVGLIIGLVVTICLLIAIILILVFWLKHKQRRSAQQAERERMRPMDESPLDNGNVVTSPNRGTHSNESSAIPDPPQEPDENPDVLYGQLLPMETLRRRQPIQLLEGGETQYARILRA